MLGRACAVVLPPSGGAGPRWPGEGDRRRRDRRTSHSLIVAVGPMAAARRLGDWV